MNHCDVLKYCKKKPPDRRVRPKTNVLFIPNQQHFIVEAAPQSPSLSLGATQSLDVPITPFHYQRPTLSNKEVKCIAVCCAHLRDVGGAGESFLVLSHACYSINTWIQVRVRFKKKKGGGAGGWRGKKKTGKQDKETRACARRREKRARKAESKGAREKRRRESDRETESDTSFGEAVSSSTSMSDACAARCRKSGSERREERRRGKSRKKKKAGRVDGGFFFLSLSM